MFFVMLQGRKEIFMSVFLNMFVTFLIIGLLY
jgi:hypothetical protein